MNKTFNKYMKYEFSLRAKNKYSEHIVIETSPEIRNLIMKNKCLRIAFNVCKCANFITIIRCYKCFGFGHFKKDCNRNAMISLCSTDHDHRNCNANHKKCLNCTKYNLKIINPNQKLINTSHDAFSESCPTYQYVRLKVLERIDYGY